MMIFLKKLKRCFYKFKNYVNKIWPYLLKKCKIKSDKIVFINFNGKGYGCNPKYIAEGLLQNDKKIDMVWLVNSFHWKIPLEIRKVKFSSIKAMYELATAKVIVTNVKNDLRFKKKDGQYIIQTWHGSYSPKYLEKEAEENLSKQYIKESKKSILCSQ